MSIRYNLYNFFKSQWKCIFCQLHGIYLLYFSAQWKPLLAHVINLDSDGVHGDENPEYKSRAYLKLIDANSDKVIYN